MLNVDLRLAKLRCPFAREVTQVHKRGYTRCGNNMPNKKKIVNDIVNDIFKR